MAETNNKKTLKPLYTNRFFFSSTVLWVNLSECYIAVRLGPTTDLCWTTNTQLPANWVLFAVREMVEKWSEQRCSNCSRSQFIIHMYITIVTWWGLRPNGGRSIYNLAANCCGGVQFDTLLAYVIKSISTTISDRAWLGLFNRFGRW